MRAHRLRSAQACVLMMAAFVFGPVKVVGQAIFPDENGKSLAGITSVDATATSVTWLNVPGNRENFDRNLQTAFELGLRRDGVRVEGSAPNYLHCGLSVAQSGGTVVYAWRLWFFDYEPEGIHRLLWTAGGIVTVGGNNFTADEAAKVCVDRFANEWLRWNPRR